MSQSMEISARRGRRRPRLGRVAANVGCLLIIVAALAFILPTAFGLSRYVISSDSMAGTYDRGSVVFEESVPVDSLRVGDVITYVPPAESGVDSLVTHRIVSIDGSTFRTQGDANPEPDPWTFELTADTQPRVVASVPYVGYAFIALTDRATRMVVIGIPAIIIAGLSLYEVLQGSARDRAPGGRGRGRSGRVTVRHSSGPVIPPARRGSSPESTSAPLAPQEKTPL